MKSNPDLDLLVPYVNQQLTKLSKQHPNEVGPLLESLKRFIDSILLASNRQLYCAHCDAFLECSRCKVQAKLLDF